MANKNFTLPIKGISEGFEVFQSPPATSGDMNNVRPQDVLEKRIRIGQRPGFEKLYTQQVEGAATPILAITSVTVVS